MEVAKKRSAAAKKGWETRRLKKQQEEQVKVERQQDIKKIRLENLRKARKVRKENLDERKKFISNKQTEARVILAKTLDSAVTLVENKVVTADQAEQIQNEVIETLIDNIANEFEILTGEELSKHQQIFISNLVEDAVIDVKDAYPEEQKEYKTSHKEINSEYSLGMHHRKYDIEGAENLTSFYNEYLNIKEELGELLPMNVVIWFNGEKGESIPRTIKAEDSGDKDKFIATIQRLSTHDGQGSNVTTGYEIDLTRMDLKYSELGFAKYDKVCKDYFMFANQSVESYKKTKEELCIWNAVFNHITSPLFKKHNDENPISKTETNLVKFNRELTDKYGFGLTIYHDYPRDGINQKELKPIMIGKVQYWQLAPITKLIKEEFAQPGIPTIKLVYCNKHVEPYLGIRDQCYVLNCRRMCYLQKDIDKDGNPVRGARCMKPCDSYRRATKDQPKITRKVVYDLETIYDPTDGNLKPYSISYSMLYDNDVKIYFELADPLNKGKDRITRKFLEHVNSSTKDEKSLLIGYNSSRFDNLLILPDIIAMDKLDDVFYQDNSILNIKWGGRHQTFDIYRYTALSLKDVCAQMMTKLKKKDGLFDHADVQNHYIKTGDIHSMFHEPGCDNKCGTIEICIKNFMNQTEENIVKEIKSKLSCQCPKYHDLVIYNIYDVLSTGEVYDKVEKCLTETNSFTQGKTMEDSRTIGGMMYKKFSEDLKKLDRSNLDIVDPITNKKSKLHGEGVKMPLLSTLEEYEKVRSSLVAGRTQCYEGAKLGEADPTLGEDSSYMMVDVVSLYPAMMTQREFPCGDITEPGKVTYEQCIEAGRIGFYDCVINQSKIKHKIIPKRDPKAPLDWNYPNDIKMQRLNTIDLQELQKRGCVVSIGEGICFTGKIHGKDLFNCVLKFKAIKQQEDVYKSSKDPEQKKKYNAGMRKVAKDCMNCLSGKVIENLHLDKTVLIKNQSDADKMFALCEKERDEQGAVSGYHAFPSMILDGKCIATYKRASKDCFKKDNRPLYLGICIYAYARTHLYNTVLEEYNPIYGDTDSALIRRCDFDRLEKDKPEICAWLNPIISTYEEEDKKTGEKKTIEVRAAAEFGQYSLEDCSTHEKGIMGFTCIAPKNYFIYGDKGQLVKKGFKGVNPSRDKYITILDNDGHLKYPDVIGWKNTPKGKKYHIKDPIEAFKLYYNPELKTVADRAKEFCESLWKDNKAYVLCSSLQKTIRTSRDGKKQAGGIYQRFMLKEITKSKVIC